MGVNRHHLHVLVHVRLCLARLRVAILFRDWYNLPSTTFPYRHVTHELPQAKTSWWRYANTAQRRLNIATSELERVLLENG